MTHIDRSGVVPMGTNDMFALPCVVMSEDITNKSVEKHHCKRNSHMNELILALAAAKPTWIFSIIPSGYNGWGVSVIERGEQLGEICWAWYRSGYVYSISNRRIEQQRERTSAYRTGDMKKALATIKKMFAANSVIERIAIAKDKAERVLRGEYNAKRSKVDAAERSVQMHSKAFLKAFQEQFNAWMRENENQDVLDRLQLARAEMLTVQAAYEAFDKHQAALVIRIEGQYIVKLRDKIEILDDTQLPEWAKARIGMLKLVNDESFITNVGCRVNAECFVVLADEEGEQQ